MTDKQKKTYLFDAVKAGHVAPSEFGPLFDLIQDRIRRSRKGK